MSSCLLLLLILHAYLSTTNALVSTVPSSTSSSSSSGAVGSGNNNDSVRQQSLTSPDKKKKVVNERPVLHDNEYDDEYCNVIDNASVEHIGQESPLIRALEIIDIVVRRVLLPLTSSMMTSSHRRGGGPVSSSGDDDDDWNEFWSRRPNNNYGLFGDDDVNNNKNERNDILRDSTSNADCLTHALEELGPVFVKLGQALASRPDAIPPSLANSLVKLQDCMQPFDSEAAKRIVTKELIESGKVSTDDLQDFLDMVSSGEPPVAAASVGQVYKTYLKSKGRDVAIKVQRPGIREVLERDANLLRIVANWIESIPAPAFVRKHHGNKLVGNRLIAAELEDAVEDFFDRIFEELDYRNEAANAAKFARLYSNRGGTSSHAHVVVPTVYPDLCTDNVLVMEWLEGTKLTCLDEDDPSQVKENLSVVMQAIDCTLSQLFSTGVLHADPHGGNLLKIQTPEGPQLGYLDFGMLSFVPETVRDALVCAVAHLVFDGDSAAVAVLLGELELVPADVIEDPDELAALTDALNQTMNDVLVYPDPIPGTIQFPELQFDRLVESLVLLVPRFRFRLPPYFVQKARAIGTLEGMALSMDSDFNVLQMLYPYALNRLMANPTNSPAMDRTLQNLIRSSDGRVELTKVSKLLADSAHLTGYRKRKVIRDVLKTPGGRRLARTLLREQLGDARRRLFRSRLLRKRLATTE